MGIISTLISNNLPSMAQAVVDKGLDYVENKTGIKLEPNMAPEKIAELKIAAAKHEEFKIEQENKNTADARDMSSRIQESESASSLAKNTAYILDFIIIVSTIIVSCLAFFVGVPDVNKELVYMALGSLITMTGTVLNFHRGSSSGSASKQLLIDSVVKRK